MSEEEKGIPPETVVKLKDTDQEVNRFYRESFDIAQNEEGVHKAFFAWAAKKGCLDNIDPNKFIKAADAAPPTEHVDVPKGGSDNLRMKGALHLTVRDKESIKDNPENLAYQVIDGMVSKDLEILMFDQGRVGHSGVTEQEDYDKREDIYGSTFRRLFIRGEDKKEEVMNYFGETEVRSRLKKYAPYIEDFKKTANPGEGITLDEAELIDKMRFLATTWSKRHSGVSPEDFFKG